MLIEGFLLGIISVCSLIAGLFFLRFWRRSGDSFFLWFAASFFIEGINRAAIVLMSKPNEGSPWTYLIRLISFLLILGAILKKNYGKE